VADITLDPKTYLPRVELDIDERYNHIPDTSSLAIRTSGLLGEQYLALNVGFEDPDLGRLSLKTAVLSRTPSPPWCWKI
jgi:phospholipid/cholesterol/gamma-HCH transport system substrate-binding protein